MQLTFDTGSIESYRQFLAVKRLPNFQIRGRLATFPDEYASRIGYAAPSVGTSSYIPEPFLYDYQGAVTEMAIRKRKFAIFADCGLGKTNCAFSYAKYVHQELGPRKRVLIITPPMVADQMLGDAEAFFGETLKLERVKASGLNQWLYTQGDTIGVTNYEALKDTTQQGLLGALIIDESQGIKGFGNAHSSIVLRLGRGLEWKLSLSGTPAPNDRIEFANQAVFLDRYSTVNAFLATFFINRGQTQNRWELKPHALRPFYRSLSDWCIFLTDPSVYGWKDNCGTIPPIHTHIEHVPMTKAQEDWVRTHLGTLIPSRTGGITTRGAYGQVAKGFWKGQKYDTNKPQYISDMLKRWPDESTLIWCLYDAEQNNLHSLIGGESLQGKDSLEKRIAAIKRFKARESMTMASKAEVLGYGLNLQVATRQIFSGLQDSYLKFYQCVKRSNRIGSTKPLNVHIPVTELEIPMIETVLEKAHRVEADAREQEQLFKECAGL